MKNIFIASFLIISTILTAQSNSNYDARLLELFSANEISEIIEEEPYRIQLIEYCLDHAFYFVETSKSKDFSERISGIVEIDDVENVSIKDKVLKLNNKKYNKKVQDSLKDVSYKHILAN